MLFCNSYLTEDFSVTVSVIKQIATLNTLYKNNK